MINDNQKLITCESKDIPWFRSNSEHFIEIGWGMHIQNNRSKDDYAYLDCFEWSGMKKGIDGYPKKYDD